MTSFGAVFLAALVLATSLRLWLALRHARHVRSHSVRVPEPFSSEVTLAAHQRAAEYTIARTRLAAVELIVEAAVALALTFGGGLRLLDAASGTLASGSVARGLLFVVFVALAVTLVELPLSLYRVFVIEERYGFNRMTWRLYWLDFAKSLLLGAAFGVPLAAAVLWLMERMGSWWWVYAWAVWVTFNVLVLAIYPTWIAPLFNRFTPMEDPELRGRVEGLLARCGFRVKGLVVMDGSTRSAHGNAYFTGFGAAKRIVFFDTLLARLAPAEVEAVLAHELGHFRLRHVVKRMALVFAASLALLWLLGYVMERDWFYQGLNVTHQSPAAALVLFFLVVPYFTFLLQPFGAMYSRRHEYEADAYAARNASSTDLASALIKLYKDNAATLTPDPLHSAFYDSHPPALARIARLRTAAQ